MLDVAKTYVLIEQLVPLMQDDEKELLLSLADTNPKRFLFELEGMIEKYLPEKGDQPCH